MNIFNERKVYPDDFPSRFSCLIEENINLLENIFDNSSDLIIRKFSVCGYDFAAVHLENMINKGEFNKQLLFALNNCAKLPLDPHERFDYIEQTVSSCPDQKRSESVEQTINLLMSGHALLFSQNVSVVLALGVQGYPRRNITDSNSEVTERGSQEAFTETIRENIALIRKRMKTPDLKFKYIKIGKLSKTDVALCYIDGIVSPKILKRVEERLSSIKIDTVLESGYLQPFLENNVYSLFTEVGNSERPDTVCGKISEGRIAILVDGTPFCLIVPYLFVENFQNLDDYTLNPVFVSFIRLLKYFSFFLSILLPGLYVAIGEFNPEIFPTAIFYKVVDAKTTTPFSLLWEALIIYTIYEIMREAGLRLPEAVGHAVSIVGALVIGDAAVSAGLIGAPMIIIVAITALASYVVPKLYYASAILRIIFIFIGGLAGVFGVIIGLWTVIVIICSHNSYGIPYSAPIVPFDIKSMRDTFIRMSWRKLSKKNIKIQKLKGVESEV